MLVEREIGEVHVLLRITPKNDQHLHNGNNLQRLPGNSGGLLLLVAASGEGLDLLFRARAVEFVGSALGIRNWT